MPCIRRSAMGETAPQNTRNGFHKACGSRFVHCCVQHLLGQADSLVGAYAGASSALGAEVGIDWILLIALRDSLNGALADTCTAADAVVTNYVSHNNLVLLLMLKFLFTDRWYLLLNHAKIQSLFEIPTNDEKKFCNLNPVLIKSHAITIAFSRL